MGDPNNEISCRKPSMPTKKGHAHHKGAQAVLCIARILGKSIMKKSLWPRLNESQHSAGSIHLRVLTNRGVICVKLRVVEYCQRAREKLMLSSSLREERERGVPGIIDAVHVAFDKEL